MSTIEKRKRLSVLPSQDHKALVIDGDAPSVSQTLLYDDSGQPLCVIPATYCNRGIVFRINDRRREAIHNHVDEIIADRGPTHHTVLYGEISKEQPWLRPRQFYDLIQKYPDRYLMEKGVVDAIWG